MCDGATARPPVRRESPSSHRQPSPTAPLSFGGARAPAALLAALALLAAAPARGQHDDGHRAVDAPRPKPEERTAQTREADAQETAPPHRRDPREQRDDTLGASLAVDVPVTAGAAAAWLAGELLRDQLAPTACRWCIPNVVDETVARAAVWGTPALASSLSDLGVYGVLPVAIVGGLLGASARDNRFGGQLAWDLLLVAEAVAVSQAANQAAKFLVARERPFVHWLPHDQKALTAQPSDNNLSFYSGHTTFAFALVTSGWTVARMRGYSWAPAFLYLGLPLAMTVGYLRMGAGKHYLGDVLVGAALGSAFGILVPALHRLGRFLSPPGTTASVWLVPLPGGALASCGWRFD